MVDFAMNTKNADMKETFRIVAVSVAFATAMSALFLVADSEIRKYEQRIERCNIACSITRTQLKANYQQTIDVKTKQAPTP
jgi:hypothetical protein